MERDRRLEAAKEARAKKRNRAMGRIAAAKALADGTPEAASTNGDLSLPPNASNATTSAARPSSTSIEVGPGGAETQADSSTVHVPAESQGLTEVNPSKAAEGATAHGPESNVEARMVSSLLQPSSIEGTKAGFPSKLTGSAANDGTKVSAEAGMDSSLLQLSTVEGPEGALPLKAAESTTTGGTEASAEAGMDTSLVRASSDSQGLEGMLPAEETENAVAPGTKASIEDHAESSLAQTSAKTDGPEGTFPGMTTKVDLAPPVAVEEEFLSAKVPTLIKSASIVDNAALAAAAALAAWTAAEAVANASPGDDDDESVAVSKGRSRSSSKGSFRERRGSSANDESVARKSFDRNAPSVDESATKAGETSSENTNASPSTKNSKTFESGNTEAVEIMSINGTSMAVERSATNDESADPQADPKTTRGNTSTHAVGKEDLDNGITASPVAMGGALDKNNHSTATAEGTTATDDNATVNAESATNQENYVAAPVAETTSMVTEDSGSSAAAIAGSVTRDDNTIESNAPAPKRGARGERKARERGRGRRREKDATSTGNAAALTSATVDNVGGGNDASSAAFEVTATANGGVGSPATIENTATDRNYAFSRAQSEVKNGLNSSNAVVENTSMVTEGSGASSAALAGSFTQDNLTIESSVPPKRRSRERGRGRSTRAQSPDTPVDSRKVRETEREFFQYIEDIIGTFSPISSLIFPP